MDWKRIEPGTYEAIGKLGKYGIVRMNAKTWWLGENGVTIRRSMSSLNAAKNYAEMIEEKRHF